MYGNGPSHSGFYPKTVGPGTFTQAWSKSLLWTGNQAVIRGDTIYGTTANGVNGSMYVFALAALDGSEKWRHALPSGYSITPPAYSDGRLYFQRVNHEQDTHFWCLDAASGRVLWIVPHLAQWDQYQTPTVAGGTVFINGGFNGGMYGFDAASGSRRFFVSLNKDEEQTPTFADGVVYTCSNGVFAAHNPVTGLQVWSHNFWNTTTQPYYGQTWERAVIPAISGGKAAVVGGTNLTVLDLAARTQLWTLAANYSGTAAIAGGVVYGISGKTVRAHDATTGTLLGTYTGGDTLIGQPIVTNDLVIASNSMATYIFDRATFALKQTLSKGGNISYASGMLCISGRNPFGNAPASLTAFTVQPSEEDPAATPLPPPAPLTTRANPARSLGNTTASWIDCARSGGIVYFLFDSPSKVERYDLASDTWLAPISLPDFPKAIAASASELYISFGSRVSAFSLDGTLETPLTTTTSETRSLFERNGKLYLSDQSGMNWLVVDRQSGLPISGTKFEQAQVGAAFGTANMFASVSTSVMRTPISTDGTFGPPAPRQSNPGFPAGTRTFLFPGEDRVATNAGIVFSTNDLAFTGSLSGAFQDLDFTANAAPVVLRTNTLVAYSSGLLETGRFTLSGTPLRIFIHNDEVHSFARISGRGVEATKTALSTLTPVKPSGPVVDPTDLAYTPDAIEYDGDGTVYLLSKQHKSVFRWSVSGSKYLPSIPLTETPGYMTYSRSLGRLYLSYTSGRISYLDLASPDLTEVNFVNSPKAPSGLKAADDILLVSNVADYSHAHYSYDSSGKLISFQNYAARSKEFVWSPSNRKLLYLPEELSSNALFSKSIDIDGNLGAEKVLYYRDEDKPQHPLRISPDGTWVVAGNGRIYTGESLQKTSSLANGFTDAVWQGGKLYTVRSVTLLGGSAASVGELQAWDESDQLTATGGSTGVPLRLFPLADSLLVVSDISGKIRFAQHGLDLEQVSSDPGNNPPPPSVRPQPNPSRPLGDTASKWIDSAQANGIAYFLFDLPAKIERYDFATETWLTPISLPALPKVFTVSPNGIFVSFGKKVSIFSLDGATETPLCSTAVDLQWLHESGGKLYVTTTTGHFGLINTSSGSLISSRTDTHYTFTGLSFCAAKNKIFGRSSNVSPSDIHQLFLNLDGTFGILRDSRYHGDYPHATRTFVSPNGELVADNAGIIYSTDDLWYMGSLTGAVDDLAFNGNAPVALRGSTLFVYDENFLETGLKLMSGAPLRLFVSDQNAFTFAMEPGRGVSATKTPLNTIPSRPPAPTIDPNSQAYTPDQVILGPDDTVLLLSKQHRNVFRWSVADRAYLPSIPLIDEPLHIAYSGVNRRLYVSYATGRISRIDLDSDTPSERPFASLPQTPIGIAAAGEFLFAADPSGAWATHYTFNASGTLVSSQDWNEPSDEYVWSPALRRMYFYRHGSPNDLMTEPVSAEGKLGAMKDSPYHGDYTFIHPIRVAPDGSVVLTGTGDLFNADSLVHLGAVTYSGGRLTDAAWAGEQLFTVHNLEHQRGDILSWARVASETAPYQAVSKQPVQGTPLRAFAIGDQIVVVSQLNSRPRFSVYDTALNRLSIDPEPGSPVPVPDPEPIEWTDVKGTYTAAFRAENGLTSGSIGMVKLTLTGKGSFTGTVKVGSRTIPIRGTFAEDGSTSVSFNFGGAPCALQLVLEMNGSIPALSGILETKTWTASIEGSRAWKPKKELHPSKGRHTITLADTANGIRSTVPPIPGVGTVQVQGSGTVKLIFIFADGKRYSFGTRVNEDSSLDLFTLTHGGRGHLQGRVWLPVMDGREQEISTLHWVKPLAANARYYPLDIATDLQCSVSRYQWREPVLDAYPSWPQANMAAFFIAGDLAQTTAQAAYLNENNRLIFGKDTEKTVLHLDRATGLVTGSFVHPRLKTRKPITAVIFPARNSMIGFFPGLRSYGVFLFTRPPSTSN